VTKAKYLTIEEIIPKDFLRHPQSVLGEFGNGQGKTHAAVEYAVRLQRIGIFDRIYILQYSQRGCDNVVSKVLRFGGWCIRHIGLEKFCPFFNQMQSYIATGIPANYFCYECQYFKNRSRSAYLQVVNEFQHLSAKAIEPKIYSSGGLSQRRVCTHPILRAYILDPASDLDRKIGITTTPIIVMPGQLFLNHKIIGKWREFSRRQRKPRKTLLIIDEGDSLFYSSLRTEIPILSPTQDDYNILKMFSPKSRRLEHILDYYADIIKILEKIYRSGSRPEGGDVKALQSILQKCDVLIRSFNRRKKQIFQHVIINKVKSNVFRIVESLEEISHIESPEIVLRTLEEDNNTYIMYDYDYGIKLFFDAEYPWKWFWKVVLSATLPADKIIESNFISDHSKRLLMLVRRRTRTYENVFVGTVKIFEDVEGILNRNKEIEYSIPRILEAIKKSAEAYERAFGQQPSGICLWFGNSKQLKTFISKLEAMKVKIYKKKRYAIFYYRKIPIFCSYCGSPIARGVDLDKYDISIVVGPLLRPPRQSGLLDIIDFGRGVAEEIQSAMRIVRSPRPAKPKIILLEKHMTTSFYAYFYPSWFKQLFLSNKIKIEE